jgi:hypothetical protein
MRSLKHDGMILLRAPADRGDANRVWVSICLWEITLGDNVLVSP